MSRVLREGAFEGETHIVTGAGQGIGNAVATALAEHAAQVVLVDLDEGRLAEARDEIAKTAPVTPVIAPANAYWHNPAVKANPESIDTAKKILKEAGYWWDNKGKLHYPK